MRRLPPRPELSLATRNRLDKESKAIADADDPKDEAARLYKNARKAKWFKPIVENLETLSGEGQRCMLCSGSEASQVEHFRPKAVFPLEAMAWKNFLWACGICNLNKGDRFPPQTEPGERIINPLEEDVWSFFFIDEFGNLTARWRADLDDLDPRAAKTIEVFALDRDALQASRQHRLDDLRKRVQDSLDLFRHGHMGQEELCARCWDWRKQPFQPDVANYFLDGPGRDEVPFAEFCALAQC
jgi:uncharacterized protein (TIGR02646 family)